jgi:hypothetical protein
MKIFGLAALAAGVLALSAGSVMAGQGNGAPSGPHYNLNIIGVENPKNATMTGSNRHTIFVALYSKKTGKYSRDQFDPDTGDAVPGTAIVDSKIWLTPGEDFQVCDGNGFDYAYDGCDSGFSEYWSPTYWENDGTEVSVVDERKNGAVFMLPCNTNISQDADTNTNCGDGIEDPPSLHYGIWARANGKYGGSATVTTCALDADNELVCSLENEVFTRDKGKVSQYQDVTDELTSLLISFCDGTIEADGSCTGTVLTERIALFSGDTHDWFWNYDNKGLRLAQLRFYEVPKE